MLTGLIVSCEPLANVTDVVECIRIAVGSYVAFLALIILSVSYANDSLNSVRVTYEISVTCSKDTM
jgi:hypothetical protein